MADAFDSLIPHLKPRDVSLIFSGAPIEPTLDDLPPVAFRNPGKAGTDIYGYITELFGFRTFALEDGTVHQTYSTTARGVEFLMACYRLLDRAPNGRDEGEGW